MPCRLSTVEAHAIRRSGVAGHSDALSVVSSGAHACERPKEFSVANRLAACALVGVVAESHGSFPSRKIRIARANCFFSASAVGSLNTRNARRRATSRPWLLMPSPLVACRVARAQPHLLPPWPLHATASVPRRTTRTESSARSCRCVAKRNRKASVRIPKLLQRRQHQEPRAVLSHWSRSPRLELERDSDL
jgi:hypothetical protein